MPTKVNQRQSNLIFYIMPNLDDLEKYINEFQNVESVIVITKDIKKSIKPGIDGYPMDPILHKDQGYFYPVEPENVKKFGKESY